MAAVWSNDWEKFHATGFVLHHIGKCGRCGRPLTVPQSKRCGLGPECASKMGVVWA